MLTSHGRPCTYSHCQDHYQAVARSSGQSDRLVHQGLARLSQALRIDYLTWPGEQAQVVPRRDRLLTFPVSPPAHFARIVQALPSLRSCFHQDKGAEGRTRRFGRTDALHAPHQVDGRVGHHGRPLSQDDGHPQCGARSNDARRVRSDPIAPPHALLVRPNGATWSLLHSYATAGPIPEHTSADMRVLSGRQRRDCGALAWQCRLAADLAGSV